MKFLNAIGALFVLNLVTMVEGSSTQHTAEQVRVWQDQKGWLKAGAWQPHETWQEHRAQRWSADSRTWAQRGGYGGFTIPQERFESNFGKQHLFHIQTRPVLYLGYPRIEYGGYSLLLVDPWPEYWPDNWYDVNEVYIDYDGGYYLHNRGYAQVRLAIAVLL